MFPAGDDELVRALTASILDQAGYRVVEAADGLEAVAILKGRCAEMDLFMLDAVMPFKTGCDVYDAVIALRPEARVLFFTGQSPNVLAEINLPVEGHDLLHKPCSFKDLLVKVRFALDRQDSL